AEEVDEAVDEGDDDDPQLDSGDPSAHPPQDDQQYGETDHERCCAERVVPHAHSPPCSDGPAHLLGQYTVTNVQTLLRRSPDQGRKGRLSAHPTPNAQTMIIYSFSVIFTTRRPSGGCTLVRRRHVDLLRITGGLRRP